MNTLSTGQSTLLSNLPSLKSLAWTLIALVIISYFVFHAVEGKHGLFSLAASKASLEQAQKELTLLQQDKEVLELQIAKLYQLDKFPDLKDELIRKNLGYIKQDEYIILNKK